MTAAKINFDRHMSQCLEAVSIHRFLDANGYNADFGLRFVWVASVSALDHYMTELIVEKSTEHFSNSDILSAKLSNEGVPMSALLQMKNASDAQAVVNFRNIVKNAVRFRTFQKADDIVDGLAYVWNEKHKWSKIALEIDLPTQKAKQKLNGICMRRDLIVHNADYDEITSELMLCNRSDAEEVINYVSNVVEAIETLVP